MTFHRRSPFVAALTLALAIVPTAADEGTEFATLRPPNEVILHPGGHADIEFGIVIREGYHLQANPVDDPFLVPTTLEFRPSAIAIPGPPAYPRGVPFVLPGSPDTLSVYHGSISLRVPIRLAPAVPPGEYELTGQLRYQACDSLKCFAPRSASFTIPIRSVPE